MSQQSMSNAQKLEFFRRRVKYLKGECHQAVHPTVIRDRLLDFIETVEWLILGEVSGAQPNLVAGVPAGALEDPTKTRVEFFSGPGAQVQQPVQNVPGLPPGYMAQPARTPVTNSDVQFIPGPPPGVSTGASNEQKVEYIRSDGVRVDANGVPLPGQEQQAAPFAYPPQPAPAPAPAAPPPPTPRIPGADYRGGQSVEYTGGPIRQASVPTGAPVSNQPAQIIATPPTINTEAGHSVAPIPGHPGGGNHILPGYPPPPPPPPGAPTTLEEARSVLPIPLAD